MLNKKSQFSTPPIPFPIRHILYESFEICVWIVTLCCIIPDVIWIEYQCKEIGHGAIVYFLLHIGSKFKVVQLLSHDAAIFCCVTRLSTWCDIEHTTVWSITRFHLACATRDICTLIPHGPNMHDMRSMTSFGCSILLIECFAVYVFHVGSSYQQVSNLFREVQRTLVSYIWSVLWKLHSLHHAHHTIVPIPCHLLPVKWRL